MDEWLRIAWSLSESYDTYMDRTRAERIILGLKLSQYMEQVYGTEGGAPGKNSRKMGI